MLPLRPEGVGCSQVKKMAVELIALPVVLSGGLVGTASKDQGINMYVRPQKINMDLPSSGILMELEMLKGPVPTAVEAATM